MTLLSLRGLTAGYLGVPVIHDVDLTVEPGEVVALLGPNGAGKTTALLAVSGLLPISGGSIEVFGTEVHAGRRPKLSGVWGLARQGLAHVPEDRGLFFDLTGAENLRLGQPRRRSSADLDRVLEWFPALAKILDRKAGLLSGGEQQMLALARAVINRPKLLLVDEMSLGLAPIIVEGLLPVLRSIADETDAGVLVVEQHVSLVLSISDRAYLLNRGRVAHAGSASDIAADAARLEANYLGTTPDP